MHRSGRDLLLLALGSLPALVLGVAWMREAGVPAGVHLQNVAAAFVGAVIAVAASRRHASPRVGLVATAVAVVVLLSTLATAGVDGVHRWIRVGPLTFHVASLVIPLVLAELDRMLRETRFAVALGVMLMVAATLAMQPDAGQATAFAGSCVVLLAVHRKGSAATIAGMLALAALAALSFVRRDPLPAVAHVEEIAVRIGAHGVVWQVAVVVVLALLIAPFVVRSRTASASAGVAVAVYLALAIIASYWGNFPVPVLGYGTSPILGYFAGWTWLRASAKA